MKHVFVFATATLLCFAACRPKDPYSLECGYCPNNTECIDDECGCPPDQLDMGSWCMQKDSHTYVASNMLGVPCFEPFGLHLGVIRPQKPTSSGVVVPASSYIMFCRSSVYQWKVSGFLYYDLPRGDSIEIYFWDFPTDNLPTRCQVVPGQSCAAYLGGRFTSPDSIRATLHWVDCSNAANTPPPVKFWLVRPK